MYIVNARLQTRSNHLSLSQAAGVIPRNYVYTRARYRNLFQLLSDVGETVKISAARFHRIRTTRVVSFKYFIQKRNRTTKC